MKIALFDIEQVALPEFMFNPYAGFKVDRSILLSGAFYNLNTHDVYAMHLTKEELKKFVQCNKIKDKDERIYQRLQIDKQLSEDILKEMDTYDLIITWYGSRHDYKYMTGKGVYHKLKDSCLYCRHIDIYMTCRNKCSFSSNRLGNMAKTLGVANKGEICSSKWSAVREGDYSAMEEIADYNNQDCITLKEVYEELKELVNNHPHFLQLKDKFSKQGAKKFMKQNYCKWCGSDNIIKNGSYTTTNGVRHPKIECKNCDKRVRY